MLKEFFENEGIFCYRELSVSDLTVNDEAKFQRIEEKMGRIESAVIFLIPYFVGQKTTNLSVYAQVKDYHRYVRELEDRFSRYCKEKKEELSFHILADTSPLDERRAALSAGLGVMGKNGLIQNERYGSLFFIGEMLLSRAFSPEKALPPRECCGCGACLAACPTGAVEDPQRRLCLSMISQKKVLTPEEEALFSRADCKWGCDLCQNACPANLGAEMNPIPFFWEDRVDFLSEEVISSPKEEFQKRAFSWRGRSVLRRNLKK
ncbi:MAG: DUF1730 domain-containing protein [Clostridia bacterium]|nr:DUF1730 domain-containing protein [Clostridia bacterium]